MQKHVIGQSIYQLIVLLIILFSGKSFLKESNSDFIRYGFGLKYCYNAPIIIEPDFEPNNIPNPEAYLADTPPTVYIISGMIPSFANASEVKSFPHPVWCNITFNNHGKLNEGYDYFKSVRY